MKISIMEYQATMNINNIFFYIILRIYYNIMDPSCGESFDEKSLHMNFDAEFKKYMNSLKESGKKFCYKCFDTRDLEKREDYWICRDCIYMKSLLNEIKKV